MKIAVIGAGVAGLATAIRLANKGHEVTIFEANSYAGGKLTQIEQAGFRFDAGPSLFTLPHLVDELVALSGLPKSTFEYERLDTLCHYFYEDGTIIHAHADPERFATELAEKTGVDRAKVLQHLQKSEHIYDLTADLFLKNSLHRVKTYLLAATWKAIALLWRLPIFGTMHQLNTKQFNDPRVVQLFNRYATYNGSDPYQAPGMLHIIPHLEYSIGAFFPKGGMHQITKTLLLLAEKSGVKLELNQRVKQIETANGAVKGVRTEQGIFLFDRVVSNMDVFPTYRRLLPQHKAPEKILQQEKSSSALIFYWGIQGTFPQLDLHNIFFSKDYEGEFKAIFRDKVLFDDPTVYVNISSKHHAADAPPNCENWFVMINVPANYGQDWKSYIERSRQNILQKLERMLGTSLKERILTENILDPVAIEQKTSSHLGALYGTSSNNPLAAFFRHPNFSNQIKGLYFCGGSAHPGGGIPLCLLSAKIVEKELS